MGKQSSVQVDIAQIKAVMKQLIYAKYLFPGK
jgi:hypothetical protein